MHNTCGRQFPGKDKREQPFPLRVREILPVRNFRQCVFKKHIGAGSWDADVATVFVAILQGHSL